MGVLSKNISASAGARRGLVALCFAGVLALGVFASGVGATYGGVKRLSAGQVNGNGAFAAHFLGASADGSRVFFQTTEKLVAADIDNVTDIYERFGSTTQRVSAGQVNGNGAIAPEFVDASADGSRVFFETTESLVADDTDGEVDVYERSGGTTKKVSIGNSTVCCNGAQFDGASADGSRVFFHTFEQLTVDDTDSSPDVYEHVGTTTQRVSAGQINGNNETGSWEARFAGASADGTKVFFHTREQLVAADGDGDQDVYRRFGGTTTKISPGDSTDGGCVGCVFPADFVDASDDGSRVLFHTSQKLTGDSDTRQDVYEVSSGGLARVSSGQVNGNGPFDAVFAGASANGATVFFYSDESLVSGDTDGSRDIYQRSGGQTKRVSAGAINGNLAFTVSFEGASADGSRVFFETQEPLVAGDTDGAQDVYERSGGSTKRVSAGQVNGNGPFGADFAGASADGTRVFFQTIEQLVRDDANPSDIASLDVYERASSQTSLVTYPGTAFNANFVGESTDASAVFFETDEKVKNDTDSATDVYGVYLVP
jgi:hypothetical protein